MAIRTLEPRPAHAAMQQLPGHVHIDVRSPQEFEAEHPAGSINIPWALLDEESGRMTPNPGFLKTVEEHFGADTPLFLSCAAGGRSLQASRELESAGYTDLVNIDGGFGGRRDPSGAVVVQGWRDCELPIDR